MAIKNALTRFVFFSLLFLFPAFANAGIVVVNGLTHLHDVVPGEVYRGVIEIQNTKSGEQAVKVYQRDYFFRHTGESLYEEPGTRQRSNAGWIDFSPTYLPLKPKEKTTIPYEIKVPEVDSLRGTYWSVIMVEGTSPVDENSLNSGLSIRTQVRYAIQIATTVGKSGEKNLTFYDVQLQNENGKRLLAIDIENRGEFLFRPDVSAEIFDEQGSSLGVFFAEKRKVYPGTSVRFFVDIDQLPTGKYQSLLLADGGEEDVFGIHLELEIPDDQ